jgi:hypothetical protein
MEDYYVSGLVCRCPLELWPGFDRQAGWGPQVPLDDKLIDTKKQTKNCDSFCENVVIKPWTNPRFA